MTKGSMKISKGIVDAINVYKFFGNFKTQEDAIKDLLSKSKEYQQYLKLKSKQKQSKQE